MTTQVAPPPSNLPPAHPTVEEQLATALSDLTTGLSSYKRARGEVESAKEAEAAQEVRLGELRVITTDSEKTTEGVRNILSASIDSVRGVLSALKATLTD